MENQYHEDEIDLIALVKSLWLERTFVYKTIIVFAVLGITSLFADLNLDQVNIFYPDLIWMMAFAFILFPIQKFGTKNKLGFREGIVLLSMYLAYLFLL